MKINRFYKKINKINLGTKIKNNKIIKISHVITGIKMKDLQKNTHLIIEKN